MNHIVDDSPPADTRWLILGTGFVGSALACHLSRAGDMVEVINAPRIVASTAATAAELADAAAGHSALEELSTQMTGIDRVVLAAGLANPNASWTPELVGANALLPGVVALAARRAGVARLIHLSSAAVQGRAAVLTESRESTPFSPYSRSKALGEDLLAILNRDSNIVIVRATSVQGPGRSTTVGLRRIARSRIASVARPGTQPSAASSISALCAFVHTVGAWPRPIPLVVLQPWQHMSVHEVLSCAGGRDPIRLPRWLCRVGVEAGYLASRLVGRRFDGSVRRLEVMWFGQVVQAEWAESTRAGEEDSHGEGPRSAEALRAVLRDDVAAQ
jgi:dTDP-4-dehydrorhamnose reductase